jgi:PAS domain S-box-containing protein
MNARVLLVTRFRDLSMKVAGSNRDALTIVHVAWLSDAIRRLAQSDFQAVMVDLDLPDAKGLEGLQTLARIAPHLPILVLGDDPVLQQLKMLEHGADDYLLKHRLDSDTLMRALHGSIARKTRKGVLLNNRRRTQLALNSIGDGVLSTNGAGLITFINPVAEQLLGWRNVEGVGRHLLEVFQVIDATTRERVVPRMGSRIQSHRTMILTQNRLLVRRDGHELPIDDYATLVYDRSDLISGMAVVIHDLTEARARARTLVYPAEHDVLTPLLSGEPLGNRRKQGAGRAPAQNEPLASGERQSSLYPGQHRPWRSRSAAPRALS